MPDPQHDLVERVAAAILSVTLVGVSYSIDFRHLVVIASNSTTTNDNYELLVLTWMAVAFGLAFSRVFVVPYAVLTAALIGHAYFLLFIESYFFAISVTKTFGALMTLSICNAVLVLRDESWRNVGMLNLAVAAAVFPLAMQGTIAYTAPPGN